MKKSIKHYMKTIITLMILSCVVLATGCRKKAPEVSSQETQTEAQAVRSQEDVLRLLIWFGYAPEKYVKKFEKEIEEKYGKKIKLEITLAESPDDFYAAIRGKKADVVTLSHHMIKDERYNYIAKKLIIPPDLENIPNYVHLIPDLKTVDYNAINGIKYSIPIAHGAYGLLYNTEVFEQTPQSWEVFWDPAFKKTYSLGGGEYIYNCNITALALGYPRELISSFDVLDNKEFRAKLRALAVNAHSFWYGADRSEELLGLSFATSWGYTISPLKKLGEVWKFADPKEGTLWWIDDHALTWTLRDKPFMKKVAEEWINKILSREYQVNNYVHEGETRPVITNIADMLTEQEKKRVLTGITPGTFTETRILQHTYSERDRNGLKLLWDEAMEGISVK